MLGIKRAFVLLFLAASASATVPPGPRKTDFSNSALPHYGGWTPRPTMAPRVLASYEANELVRRDFMKTCAYIGGLQQSPLVCSTGYCGFASGVFGCCDSTSGSALEQCHFQTTCYSYGASCDSHCSMDPSAIHCDKATPSCVGYRFADTKLLALGCGPVKTTFVVAGDFTTTAGMFPFPNNSSIPMVSSSTLPLTPSFTHPVYTTSQAPPPTPTHTGMAAGRASCRGAEFVSFGVIALLCGLF